MARHPQGISGWKNKHEDWNCGTGGEEQVEIGVCLGLSNKCGKMLLMVLMIEGSLEVKLPTIWTDEKQRWEESEKRREEEKKKEDQRRERVRRKKTQVREKVGKSRNTVFPMICGSGGSKSRLAKAAGAEPFGQMRDEQLHAVVVRSIFPSQNVQSAPTLHFWKLRCQKSARRCGAKHIFQSKCTKHTIPRPLFEVDMSKKCTLFSRTRFPSQNVQSTPFPDHVWKLTCRKSARRCGAKHISKSKC